MGRAPIENNAVPDDFTAPFRRAAVVLVVAVDLARVAAKVLMASTGVRTANAGMAIATRGMANKPSRQRHDVYFNDVFCGQVSKSGPMTHCCKGSGPGLWP